MAKSGAAPNAKPEAPDDLPVAATAVRLIEHAGRNGRGMVFVARSERRALLLTRILRGLAPKLAVLPFPAWDCVPYDRAPPSREVMGRRIAALSRLAEGLQGPWLVVTTPDALAQRVPPQALWRAAALRLWVDEAFDADALQDFLLRSGYVLDDRVDEAGEAAIRGAVVDIFAAGAEQPYRLDHAEGRLTGIRRYDPATQRTLSDESDFVILPASEVALPADQGDQEGVERFAGIEHFLPDFYHGLETVFDYLPAAEFVLDDGAEEAQATFWEQVRDAYETRRTVPRGGGARPPLAPERLYLTPTEWDAAFAALTQVQLPLGGINKVPSFARERDPGGALAAFAAGQLEAGRKVVLAASIPSELRALSRRLAANQRVAPHPAGDWQEIAAASAGSTVAVRVDIDRGFVDQEGDLALIGAPDLLGSRAGQSAQDHNRGTAFGFGDTEFRPGDTVVHLDHGLALLRGIETIAPAAGAAEDAIILEFAAGAKLLVPAADMGRIWRYGTDSKAVSLDRLAGTAWPKRRAELEAEIGHLAARLVALAGEREQAQAERLIPPRRDYEGFAARFPFAETPDQAHAIEAALDDLAAGRPMDRLVCGDVGYGKTEVALRAAAAAVLAGKQVAVVAPTTVLVRQHVSTFRRRFAGLGVEVAHLSRLVKPAEARAVKAGLSTGEIMLVVGTHALAGKGVRFRNLGLVVIDEEHRFGKAQKEKLRALADRVHVLTLTATPIPRTLQTAMVGLQDLSVIATPPTRRQPVRTFVTAFDPVTVRAALMRERSRGGQSFVVCPRIEDIEPMVGRLAELVPELQVLVAHGKMPADAMDAAMVDFAEGIGDVLLATNIIESGLDVPRANTILVWRADRFGLAQLHQLRGRVGRGRARGTAYLLTDPEAKIAAATEKRLRTLETLDRLGAGFAISGQDLDMRGAGDLLGEEQAGHVKLIGLALYQHLMERALATARGNAVPDEWVPVIHLGVDTAVTETYMPEPEIRINLHARIARLGDDDDPESLREELADRFGPPPEPLENMIALAELSRRARKLGVAKLEAGPEAIAATFRDGAAVEAAGRLSGADGMQWRGDRLVWTRPTITPSDRRRLAGDFLTAIAGVGEAIRPKRRAETPELAS